MKKLTTLMLGLSLALGTTALFAQDAPKDDTAKTEKHKKKKHDKKKKDDTKTDAPKQ